MSATSRHVTDTTGRTGETGSATACRGSIPDRTSCTTNRHRSYVEATRTLVLRPRRDGDLAGALGRLRTPGPRVPDGGRRRRGDRARGSRRGMWWLAGRRAHQAVLLRQRRGAGDARRGRLARIPVLGAQRIPSVRARG